MKDLSVVVGYIMYYDLLQNIINGSFFSKIDKAIKVAEMFCSIYPPDFKWGAKVEFEGTLVEFIKKLEVC